MPSYLTDFNLWRDLLPTPLFALIVATALSLPSIISKKLSLAHFTVLVAMSLLGATTGQLTGQSRDPAVGAVLPAVLGFIGGMGVYLLATQKPHTQQLVGVSIIAFSLTLLTCSFWGAKLRSDYDVYKESLAQQLVRESNAHELRLQKLLNEKQLLEVRRALKLEDHPGK